MALKCIYLRSSVRRNITNKGTESVRQNHAEVKITKEKPVRNLEN